MLPPDSPKKEGRPQGRPSSAHLSMQSRQSESPFSFTLIAFLCVGSSLLIESLSLLLPFLVGAYVTVTVLDALGGTVSAA